MGVTREKMQAQLRRAIQAVLDRGLHDPRIRGLISVTRVELSEDFANATVHVSVLPESAADLSMHGLTSATAHVRSQVSRRADFRRVPALHFRRDVVRRRESDVLTAIARATAEDEARAALRGPVDAEAEGEDGAATSGWPAARAPEDTEAPMDADVLSAFDAFVNAATEEGPEVGSSLEAENEHRPAGSDELMRGDAPVRRPEEDPT